ncbi:MAG: aldose epimerase family protein [Thalassotalea sp.]
MTKKSPQLNITKQQLVNSTLAAPLEIITLANCHGLTVSLSNLGASIWSVTVPEKSNNLPATELVLNYQNIEDWAKNPYYFGVTAGRVANRIGGANFELEGKTIHLAANEGDNQLHGGPGGLSQCFWSFETSQDVDSVAVTYHHHSPDGDQGFPGNMDIELTYRLSNNNELTLTYQAVADQSTPICLTNHAYWNLAGTSNGDILSHTLELPADYILALNEQQIPTGELNLVTDSAFDFRTNKAIGKDIEQLKNGYDHYFVVKRGNNELMPVAKLTDPKSGRVMEILSTEAGIQLYSGNFLDGSHIGSNKQALTKHMGLCLETHGFPDAVNHAHFPSVMVNKGEVYQQTTLHRFSKF